MRFLASTSPALLFSVVLSSLAFAQNEEELTPEEIAALEAEAEAAEKAENEAKAEPKPESKKSESAAPAEPSATTEAGSDESDPAPDGIPTDAVFEPGQEPYRKPSKGKAVLWGRLVDSKTGEPAIEAQVSLKGTKFKAITDFDGYYRLEVPAGKYTVEVFYELHEPVTLSGVGAATGKVARVDIPLKPQGGIQEEVVFQDEAEKQTVAGLALARQRSASTGDAIGRAEITKTGDSNAAAAAKRVVGANIVGGRFVYVRGLGERYSNSLLSGFPLPSPEPDRAAVPLDVFPASVLDSLTIAKTFTPDMPGDFAGGSVQIETRSVPDKPLFNIQILGGYNSQSTFKNRLESRDSATDALGFDSGMRSLPSQVPTDRSADQDTITDPNELRSIGRAMNSPMSALLQSTPINHGFAVVAGNTWTFSGQKLGMLASVNYQHNYERIDNMILRDFRNSEEDPKGWEPRVDLQVQRGIETIRAGAFAKISYIPSEHHKLTLTGIHSQLADDTTSLFNGTQIENAFSFAALQNDWVERGMTFGVLSGRHTIKSLNEGELGWDVALAAATRKQPDRRDVVYGKTVRRVRDPATRTFTEEDIYAYANRPDSGRHFWANQEEIGKGAKLDYRQPILKGEHELSVKGGGLVNVKDRSFSVRRFQMWPDGTGDALICKGSTFRISCPDSLFTDDNIGPVLRVDEGSLAGDAYTANLGVFGGYLLADYEFMKKLRLVGGGRVEVTDQSVTPASPFGGEVPTDVTGARLNSVEFLPSISVLHSVSKSIKGRYSYTRTLARPQLRELAPFAFADYFAGRVTGGNPNLVLTNIDNFDVRLEYWPTQIDVLAVSLFLKQLKNPIETILVATADTPQITYENSPEARVIGVELEVRKSLGFLTSVLKDFSVISNFTATYSRVEISAGTPATSVSRPLMNQAPWVFNAGLAYENEVGTDVRASYNVNGPTIVEVGTRGIPDGYLHPFDSLDINARQKFLDHWSVRLGAQNIFNAYTIVTQGEALVEENIARKFRTGSVFTVALGYEY